MKALDRARATDWALYVVTDSRLAGDRPLVDVVAAALRGGATVIQYREKRTSTREMVQTAATLREVCLRHGALFIVNDRIDVALAVDADGVHVGQDDMPAPLARRLIGPARLLGVSVHTLDELRQAEADGADHVSISPVFATPTKPDHQAPVGLESAAALACAARVPVVCIGGIGPGNAGEVARCGVGGVCVVSAVIAAPDPEKAARELVTAVRAARAKTRGAS